MRKILCAIIGLLFTIPSWALPAGYTELEYIESTGTQYLDLDTGTQTGVFKIIADVYAAGSTNWQYLFGYSKDAGGSPLGVWVSNDQIKETFIAGNGNVIADVNKWEHIDITNSNTVTIPDFYIFHVNPTGVTSYTINHGRIKYLQLKKDGDTIRDMVPAKRNSDGVVGMYDTVNNRFYTNAGSGSFIAGPETTGQCANMYDYSYRVSADFELVDGNTLRNLRTTNNERFQLSIYDTINKEMAANKIITAPGNYNVKFNVVRDNNTMYMYHSGSNGNLSFWTAKKINPGEYVLSFDVLSTNPSVVGGLQLKNISLRPAYCSEIQVATTKYAETVFNPLNTALQNAISVVDSVVSNTISQAASIATLQSGKQTRPNDIADNNEKCPAGKKCLLVEGTDGKPHWYEIFDPINRWMEGWIAAGKPAPQHTSNSNTLLRWQGNPNFRETYVDGYRDVYVRQWDASPARTVGGMYQTLPAGDIENAGTWAVEYDGTEGDGVNAGVVYGVAKCTTVNQAFATKLTSANESAFYELPTPVGQTDNANYPRENFKNCWCKMTAVGVPGADGTAANGAVYPVNSASSAWVFRDLRSSASDCANYCTFYCVDNIRSVPGFRTAVFGLSD